MKTMLLVVTLLLTGTFTGCGRGDPPKEILELRDVIITMKANVGPSTTQTEYENDLRRIQVAHDKVIASVAASDRASENMKILDVAYGEYVAAAKIIEQRERLRDGPDAQRAYDMSQKLDDLKAEQASVESQIAMVRSGSGFAADSERFKRWSQLTCRTGELSTQIIKTLLDIDTMLPNLKATLTRQASALDAKRDAHWDNARQRLSLLAPDKW
ncbi:MAG: hypothetical protein WCI73_09965 [Phycisphaerae bacterium]